MKNAKKEDSKKCKNLIRKGDELDEEISEYLFQNSINEFITLQNWISSECVRALEIISIVKTHYHGSNKKILESLEKNIPNIRTDSESALKGILSKICF